MQTMENKTINTVVCEGYNHTVTISDKELEEKEINSIEELHTKLYGTMCIDHLSSECFRCKTCLKRGFTRYDSLVLCEEHNNEFLPTMQKLNSIFENNPNVLVISDLGL